MGEQEATWQKPKITKSPDKQSKVSSPNVAATLLTPIVTLTQEIQIYYRASFPREEIILEIQNREFPLIECHRT